MMMKKKKTRSRRRRVELFVNVYHQQHATVLESPSRQQSQLLLLTLSTVLLLQFHHLPQTSVEAATAPTTQHTSSLFSTPFADNDDKSSSSLANGNDQDQVAQIINEEFSAATPTTQYLMNSPEPADQQSSQLLNYIHHAQASFSSNNNSHSSSSTSNEHNKRMFVVELLRMLHEQYATAAAAGKMTLPPGESLSFAGANKKEDSLARQQVSSSSNMMMSQLLGAIGADGDVRRLIDWVQNWFSLASVGELTTQFVVSKLGSVNCAALLKPDSEETLIPRFLLFNEQFPDVPFELKLTPSRQECLQQAHFDPNKKTLVLIHGYLTGYTLVDGLTNLKNRVLDLNKHVSEKFAAAASGTGTGATNNSSSLFYTTNAQDQLENSLNLAMRRQQYNVIIVDWFNGANPTPRSRYIRAAVNAQVVGKLIARFLTELVVQCGAPAQHVQIIAHSLGCHVAGFTAKAMQAVGHKLGKITHLDPVGLCFGRLFSEPRFRLNPEDAIETKAVHVSLNLFDNPLDGAQANFLVNGGRDQAGCGGASELKNSTSSSVALLFDNEAKFRPCSHLRAVSIFEDDLSSEPGQCQIVGYRCATYERFLAGKCGRCDAQNNQCRLMSLDPLFGPPVRPRVRRITGMSIQQHVGGLTSENDDYLYSTFHLSSATPPSYGSNYTATPTSLKSHYQQITHPKTTPPSKSATKNASAAAPLHTTTATTTATGVTSAPDTSSSTNLPPATSSASGSSPRLTDHHKLNRIVNQISSNGSIAWIIDDPELNQKIGRTIARLKPELIIANHHQQQQREAMYNKHQQQQQENFDQNLEAKKRVVPVSRPLSDAPESSQHQKQQSDKNVPRPTVVISDGSYDEDDADTTNSHSPAESDDEKEESFSDEYPKVPKVRANLRRRQQQQQQALDHHHHQSMNNEIMKRNDRSLSLAQRERLTQTLDKLRSDTRHALSEGWSSLKSAGSLDAKFRVSSLLAKSPFQSSALNSPAVEGAEISNPIGAAAAAAASTSLLMSHPVQMAANLQQMAASMSAAASGANSNHMRAPAASAASATAPHRQQQQQVAPAAASEENTVVTSEIEVAPPLGSQSIPAGSVNAPIYFVGTGAITPYCVNYYQLRILIAESRINRLLVEQQQKQAAAAAATSSSGHHQMAPLVHVSNNKNDRNSPHQQQQQFSELALVASQQLQRQVSMHSNQLHLTVKLTDSRGHFFMGLTLSEDARYLLKIPIDDKRHRAISGSENMVELTMLLNTTSPVPIRVSETIISYYFHKIVLADLIEINYMSNISPQVRARYSSLLCPLAINDQHQLVRYVECDKVPAAAAAKRRKRRR